MIGPMVALATTTAPAKPGEYSGFFSICLMLTRPGPAASAMALPLMPEKMTPDQDIDLREAARQAADQNAAEIEETIADRAGVHQVGGKNEERHPPAAHSCYRDRSGSGRRPNRHPAPLTAR